MRDRRGVFAGWHVSEGGWRGAATYHVLRWLPLVGVAVLTYFVFPLPAHLAAPALRVGDVADQTITAPFYFIVPKSDGERALEGQARALAARPVYRFDGEAYDSVTAMVDTFFANLDLAAQDGENDVRKVVENAGTRLGPQEVTALLDRGRRRAAQAALASFFRGTLSEGVADAGVMRAEPSRFLALRRGEAERVVPRDSILTFPDLLARAEQPHPGVSDEVGRRTVRQLATAFYRPTIVPDPALTNLRREELRLSVDTVKYSVPAGERIVLAGRPVTEEARDKLLGLRDELHRRGEDAVVARTVLGGLLYNATVLAVFWLLILLYLPETYAQLREMVFFGVLFGLVVLLSGTLTHVFPWRPELLPIPFAAILITMLYNGRTAVVAAFTLAILLGGQWALRESNTVFFGMVGGVAAALGMRVVRRRRHLYVTIGVVAGAYTLAALTAGLIGSWNTGAIATTAITGSIVALSSASFALLMVPLAESATRITTDLTLLELSDLGRPLLQRLALEAPGTWAHSIAMANLCEAACNVIGANGLLARVGCYYHDIGKLRNPQYFVENQTPGNNPHDALSPEESASIIRDHVAYGSQLAEAAGLPKVVRAFIPEHHGTTEINYFLHRARRRSAGAAVDVRDFRYPGPRPQSVETAVAMLADSSEAAVRVLDDPTPAMVRTAIEHLVEQKLHSRQLEEAPITLRDLDRIKDEFCRTMAGMYHNRIGYPRASGGIEPEFAPAERT
ncbi:MAG TPA: HDIG domain-containing protein [Gemmatimonadales bacterium]|nr:HDIG domain-containing protein [Gemmatimonadales bacterium]